MTPIPLGEWPDPVAVFTAPAESAFAAELDGTLREIIADGTWRSLFVDWFEVCPAVDRERTSARVGRRVRRVE